MRARHLIAAALFLAAPLPVHAEDPPSIEVSAATPVDAGDLWRRVRHHELPDDGHALALEVGKPYVVLAPAVGVKPTTGINGGVATNIAFISGASSSTHVSSVSGSLKFSEKKQTLSSLRLGVFLPDDRWFIEGDNRFLWTSQDTYGLGGATMLSNAENLKYDALRVYETLYRTVAPNLFVGAGLDVNKHANVRPVAGATSADSDAYALYSRQHGFDVTRQTSSGTTASVMFDSRDNSINAQQGWLASATYRTFIDGFLGGDATWQEVYVDVRTYRKLTRDGRRRLAFWVLGDFVTGGVAPYLDLPATAGDTYGRSARGYGEGRYRGEHLLYGEVEFRDTLTRNGLLGYVVFLNTTTIDSDAPGEHLFDAFAPGAGAGLRVLLNKKSRTNLCVDYGRGKQGSHGLYLAIQEAF